MLEKERERPFYSFTLTVDGRRGKKIALQRKQKRSTQRKRDDIGQMIKELNDASREEEEEQTPNEKHPERERRK